MSGTHILSEKMVLMFSYVAASGLGSGGVVRRASDSGVWAPGWGTPDGTRAPCTARGTLNQRTAREAPENAEDDLNHRVLTEK